MNHPSYILLSIPLQALTKALGDRALLAYNGIRGVCTEPVKPKGLCKSLMAAKSFPALEAGRWEDLARWMGILAEELVNR